MMGKQFSAFHIHHTPIFARNVFGVIEVDDTNIAQKGVKELIAFYDSVGMPKSLKEAGIEEEKLEYLAEKVTELGDIGTMSQIIKAEALEIYKMAC